MKNPGYHHGFAVLGMAGWQAEPDPPIHPGQPVGHAAWTAVLLHGLDPANPVQLTATLGDDPGARPLLKWIQEQGMPLHGLQQIEGQTTWDGASDAPAWETLIRSEPRIRASTACFCMELGQESSEVLRPLEELRQDGLRLLVSSPALLSQPCPALGQADYLIAAHDPANADPEVLKHHTERLLGTGVFLLTVSFDASGVARKVRGTPGVEFLPWPAPLPTLPSRVQSALTAALLHSLRHSYDAVHTLELLTAAGWWVAHHPSLKESKRSVLELLGQAMRAQRHLPPVPLT
jgi:hypothetical protein